jgi:acyl-CoA reductase-like NAD-dependent aldehyde dehydrogenase
VDSLEEAIALVNSNEHGNGTAIFTSSGAAARKFQHDIQVGEGCQDRRKGQGQEGCRGPGCAPVDPLCSLSQVLLCR